MPLQGTVAQRYPLDITPEARHLADLLNKVYPLMPGQTIRKRAELLRYSAPHLSHILNGSRHPDLQRVVKRMYLLAVEHSGAARVPVSLSELLQAHDAVIAARHRGIAPVAAVARTGGSASPYLPVRPGRPDRQVRQRARWGGAADIASLLQAGREMDAVTVLTAAGKTLSPAELCMAVRTLRDDGQNEAADKVLQIAGRRGAGQILPIVTILNETRRSTDIAVLLRSAASAG